LKIPPLSHHRPTTLEEAFALLADYGSDAKVLAGGQSLVPLLALRLARPQHLIDIGRLRELDTIDSSPDGLTIGAGVRHATVERSPVAAQAAPVVTAAVPLIGHRAIRNRGTVCGSLAHADPAAELPAAALAADAELVLCSTAGTRRVAAAEFFLGYLTSAIDDTEILTAVRFPAAPPRTGAAVAEVSRRHGDYALVGVATVVGLDERGRVGRAALSFFGAGATPVRVREAELTLVGEHPDPAVFAEAAHVVTTALDPPEDNHATAAYRAHVAGVLTRRALSQAVDRAQAAA